MTICHAQNREKLTHTLCGILLPRNDRGGAACCFTLEVFAEIVGEIQACKDCSEHPDSVLAKLAIIDDQCDPVDRIGVARRMVQNKCIFCGEYKACLCERRK